MSTRASEKPVSSLVRSDLEPRSPRGPVRLVWHQVRFDIRAFIRDSQARFFTIAMPVGFLVLFVAMFGNGWAHVGGHQVRNSTYYVANLTVFGIIDSAFMSLGIALVNERETGVLRRRQASPQPRWIIMTARAVTSLLTTTTIAALVLTLGRVAYGATVPFGGLPALAAAVVIGSVATSALAFAVTTVIRSSESAQPVVTAVSMPLFFISGVFVPWSLVPSWLRQVAEAVSRPPPVPGPAHPLRARGRHQPLEARRPNDRGGLGGHWTRSGDPSLSLGTERNLIELVHA